jgi:hypothetical protein
MELNDRVTQLEDEIKILKNEVQAVLLDLRESYLNQENPFNPAASLAPIASQPIIISQPPPATEEEPDDGATGEDQESQQPETDEPAGELELIDLPELPGEPETTEKLELTDEPEPDNELEPVSKQAPTATEEIADEEVKRAWRPLAEIGSNFKPGVTTCCPDGKIELSAIDGLTEWLTEAVKRFGRERTEAILGIAEMMGHLIPELKNIMIKFINPIPGEYSGKVTTQDYLASLITLGNLLGNDNKSEIAMLYMLCQENDDR